MADLRGLVGGGFRTGDHVSHEAFGYGRVTEVVGDFVTVDFEDVGSKKLMARVAPLALLSRGPRTPSVPTAAKVQPVPKRSQATVNVVGVRKELLSHVQALHTRYDAEPEVVEEGPKDSLRSKMQAHLEKLRGGTPTDDAPTVPTGGSQGTPLSLPDAIALAGVTFEGRQMNLARAREGDAVRLVRRPENAFDPNAVEVLTVGGESLGWVPKVHSTRIAAIMDAGTAMRGQISALVGNLEAGYNLGASIALIVEGPNLEVKKTINVKDAKLERGERSTPSSATTSFSYPNSDNDFDSEWEPSLSDGEPLDDESAEGLGVGDVGFEDADTEY